MRWYKWLCGIIFSIAALMVTIITAVDIAVYGDMDYFRREYEKYDVNNENSIVNMSMDELMRVTYEMMDYLKGNREDLVVYAEVDGENQEFFNDIEKFHMEDCRDLFVAAIKIRYICIAVMVIVVIVMAIMKWQPLRYIVNSAVRVLAFFYVILFALVSYIVLDFERAFTQFHLIFFDNDMWLLDPTTDRLINIVPQGFFVDTAARIGIVFFMLTLSIFALVFFLYRGTIKKIKTLQYGGNHEQG